MPRAPGWSPEGHLSDREEDSLRKVTLIPRTPQCQAPVDITDIEVKSFLVILQPLTKTQSCEATLRRDYVIVQPIHRTVVLDEPTPMFPLRIIERTGHDNPPQLRETFPAPTVLSRFERSTQSQIMSNLIEPTRRGASMYAEDFAANLKTFYPRFHKKSTESTQKTAEQLREQLRNFLKQELAINTMENYGRTMAEFDRFLEVNELPPTNYAASLFIVDLFYDDKRRESLSISGIYQYAKEISAACNGKDRQPEGWESQGDMYLKKVKRILYNMGAEIPNKHAKPMTRDHAYLVLTIRGWKEEERMVVFAMWMTASRDVDILALNCADCRLETEGGDLLIVFEWRPKESATGPGSGRTKNNAGKVLTCVVNARENTQRLWKYMESRKKKNRSFTDLSESEVIQLLKRLDPEYTGHSPKRGALNHLGRCKVGFEMIGRMARHHQPARDLPRHTQVYLEPEILGLMGRTQDVTKLL